MMQVRSIRFRLTAWYSLLLLAFLTALSLAVWIGIRHSTVAAVDELLSARVRHLVEFVDTEFPDAGAVVDSDGEIVGVLESVDPGERQLVVSGQPVAYDGETEFAGGLASLREGRYVEVITEPVDGRLLALEVVVLEIEAELAEELSEFVLTISEGRLLQIRDGAGKPFIPVRGETGIVPWIPPPAAGREFHLVETAEGPLRLVSERVMLAGQGFAVVAASSLNSVVATQKRLLSWMFWAFPIGMLLSIGGGVVISRIALRSVEVVAGLAAEVDVENLSRRIKVPPTGDVVERLGRTFNQMLDRLETSVSKLDQFTADASHELRSPVSVIRTTAELALRGDRSPEELRQDMADIQTEAEQLTALIEDLLTLARADGRAEELPMTALDLSKVARKACAQQAAAAGQRGIGVGVTAPEDQIQVNAHPQSLERLFRILLENALEHTPAGGKISVTVEASSHKAQFSVRDTGAGIPPEHLDKVFDRFYRADESRARSSGGSGLGLSIAKWIAGVHRGTITATSPPGRGAIFCVVLPRKPVV